MKEKKNSVVKLQREKILAMRAAVHDKSDNVSDSGDSFVVLTVDIVLNSQQVCMK